jgi:peptide/nickel transport system permease protein
MPHQYWNWITAVLQVDLGTSIFYRMNVATMIGQRLPITMYLGSMALVLAGVVGISAGVVCALKRGTWIDGVVTTVANLGITAPSFWVGVLMIYLFALKLGWLPVQGFVSPFTDFTQSLRLAVMPVIVLSIGSIASLTRQTRSSMLEVIRQDYIRTARSKGLSDRVVTWRHVLKNGLMPVITLLGMQVRVVFGGAVVIETVFNIPGMGRMMVEAVFGQDYTIVQAVALLMAVIVVLSNLIVDIAYGWLDPRIQYS